MPNNDSHQHVVKTSAQWNDRAVEYWVVPRGCLCVELTSRGKTKLKVGEGNKYYAQLPYICDIEDLSDYYTKEEINNLFNNLNRMAIMSTEEYDEKSDLPLMGNKLGDVRFVKSSSPSLKLDPDIYLWNGHKWIFVGYDIIDIDLSQYIKREEFEPVAAKVDEMYPKMHTHENKETLDRIEEPYTTAEKDKLDSLENYDDTEIRALIRQATHVHPNKSILDQIQQPFKNADKAKLDSLENYDDTELRDRISDVEAVAHTHSNKNELDSIYSGFVDEHQALVEFKTVAEEEIDDLNNDVADLKTKIHTHSNKNILDSTTAPYTTQDKATLDELASITIFDGASPTYDGFRGYVPAPLAGQQSYFLRGDGTWQPISGSTAYEAGPGIEIAQGTYETYRVVEYFQSNGSQTVDTGYCKTVANGSMNFEIKWRLISTPTAVVHVLSTHDVGASVNIGSVYIGVNKVSSMSEYKPAGGIITSSDGYSYFQYDSSGTATSTRSDLAGFDNDGDISFNMGSIYSIDTGATWRNVFLYDSTPAAIYFCRIFDDDVLVCDLVPCIRDEDNAQGFYDRVREIFIENTGTAFTMGQETGEVISRFVHESESDPYEITNTGIIEASYSKQNLELTLRNRNETIIVPVSDTQYTAGDNITVTGQQESFTLLQYIRGKGNQTINTHKRITSQEGKFEYKFQMKDSLSTSQNYRFQAIISGEYLHEASAYIGIGKGSNNVIGSFAGIVKSGENLSWYWITQNSTTNLEEGSMAYHSDGTITKDGSVISPDDWPVINDDEIYIFGNRDHKANCDLYYVKIYDNNVLIFDGIPVRRNSDGEIGLFDRVDNTFYMNDLGGGSFGFAAGPDVSGADPILGDYIGTTKTISATVGVTSVTQDSQNQNILHVTTNGVTTDITIPDYILPIASDQTLGGIKVGNNLSIDANGVLSATSGRTYYPGQGIEFGGETLEETSFRMSDFIRNLSGRNCTLFKNDILSQIRLTATDYDAYTIPYIGQVSGVDSYTFTAEPNTKYRLTWESNAPNVHGRVFVFENQDTTNMYSVDQATASSLTFTTSSTCNVLTFRVGVQNTGDIVTYSNIQLFKVIPNNNVINAKIGIGLTFDSNDAIELDDSIKLRLNCNNEPN